MLRWWHVLADNSLCSEYGKTRLFKHHEILNQSLIIFYWPYFFCDGTEQYGTWLIWVNMKPVSGYSEIGIRLLGSSLRKWFYHKLEIMLKENKYYLFWSCNSELLCAPVSCLGTNAKELQEQVWDLYLPTRRNLSLKGYCILGLIQQILCM